MCGNTTEQTRTKNERKEIKWAGGEGGEREGGGGGERGRERERERETDRQTDRQTDRHRQRETDYRETETDFVPGSYESNIRSSW